MPRTAEDVENYLIALDRPFENTGGTYVVHNGESQPPLAIRVAPPIVEVMVTIGAPPSDPKLQTELFRRLLQHNAADLIHASYGLEDGTIVLSAALPLENIDQNELEAVLSDIDLALARHIPELRTLATNAS